MLTDNDLTKIGKLVQKEITPIRTDVKSLGVDFKKEINPIKKDLKSFKSDVLSLKKTIFIFH